MKRMKEAKQSLRTVVYIAPYIRDLVPSFIQGRKKDVRIIHRALARRDYAAIEVLGHQMKGSGASYGFAPITQIGKSIEEAARDKDILGIRKNTDELLMYLNQVKIIYG